MRIFNKLGPGILIAAAFIGPGTVTVCTLAGVGFGYSLLWAMLLSLIATVVLQEMSARLGIVSRQGLGDTIRQQLSTPWARLGVLSIVLGAIVVGNAAYEAGNIGGASLGLEAILGSERSYLYPWIVSGLAFLLLYAGSYRLLEKVFMGLVGLMSLSFLFTALLTRPDPVALLKGLLLPEIPEYSLLTLVALVGTTVVPYNLFLHASLVNEKWKSAADLPAAARDTLFSIALGGLVSMAIIVSAAALPGAQIQGVEDLAKSLEPLYGSSARYFMGLGLFAAGITSSITAPLAAAYVANSCFGWGAGLRDIKFRLVWGLILLLGACSLSFGYKPIEIIKFAQVANGILLPVIACFLLWVVNKASVMGPYRNTAWHNLIAGVILALAILLGLKSVGSVFGIL